MFLGKERLFQKIKKNKEFRVLYVWLSSPWAWRHAIQHGLYVN